MIEILNRVALSHEILGVDFDENVFLCNPLEIAGIFFSRKPPGRELVINLQNNKVLVRVENPQGLIGRLGKLGVKVVI